MLIIKFGLAMRHYFTQFFCLSLALTGGLAAQEEIQDPSEDNAVTRSGRGPATILIGPEHVVPSETRYPLRNSIGGQGVEVEFSFFPVASSVRERTPPPRLSDLIGNPARQAALNNSAKPGDWVTPPAATR